MPLVPGSPQARLGLASVFGSTFFELVGYFMMTPWLLLQLKAAQVPTALAGLFAASSWVGIFLVTPMAAAITRRLGRRRTLWVAAALPVASGLAFGLTTLLPLWFVLMMLAGMASGLRWVLAEAVIAELSPPGQRGRYVGIFETMVGMTFVLGPVTLAWVGPQSRQALWLAVGFMAMGLAWSLLIPRLPPAADAREARVGLHGIWQALRAHPVIMMAGFTGGFFESGLTSLLTLYGLALGLGPQGATLLVGASGLGSALLMLPAGLLADRLAHPRQGRAASAFWGDERHTRLQLMRVFAAITLSATLAIPWVAQWPALAWPVAFVWGGAGGCLYTLAMIDIGSRETGITLVNSTAVLVMSYTVGGMLAPSSGAAALQWSPQLGFPALLTAVAATGLWLLMRARLDRAV